MSRLEPLFYVPDDGVHKESTFRTLLGRAISELGILPFALSSGTGRYSRVQIITEEKEHDGKRIQKSYIVKHLRSQRGINYVVENVIDEIKNLQQFLGNPYVVQLLGANVYKADAFLVFPYIPGKTLWDWLKSDPKPPLELRKQRYTELWEGLKSIHAKGFAHLDIQPNNIWIPEDPATPAFYLDLGAMYRFGEERTLRISTTKGYYPAFENITIARPYLNYYAFEKVLDANIDAVDEKIKTAVKHAKNAATEPVGGAGAGAGANKGGGRKTKRVSQKRRKTRRYCRKT